MTNSVINLGAYGKLILPVQVDGDRWFYYWDVNGDGQATAADKTTHIYLDSLFKQNADGTFNPGSFTTNTYRYASLNGELVALPTMGQASFSVSNLASQTSVSGAALNNTYDDYLAIYDGYSLPPGWVGPHFWTSSPYGTSPTTLTLSDGYKGAGSGALEFNVALEYLGSIPAVSFATTSGSANEGNSGNQTVNVTANLSSPAITAVTVPIMLSGTATKEVNGEEDDYWGYSNQMYSINIPLGGLMGSATFSVQGDNKVESNETVILTMGAPVGATLGANTSYTHTITNDDPTISFAATTGSANESNSGTQTVYVSANLSSATTSVVTVPITYSGTATSGSDYSAATTSITIAAGATTGTASFSVVGDTALESNETVVLTMGTPTGVTLGANTSYTHTITNDDGVIDLGAGVIDLGSYGKLILPVQADGDRWFYYWDVNGDGQATEADKTTHIYLDSLFKQSADGTFNPGSFTTNTYRYASLNGELVALPTMGQASFSVSNRANQTSVSGAALNSTYDDYLAIYDGYSLPTGWVGPHFWTSSPYGTSPTTLTLSDGYKGAGSGALEFNVALEYLGQPLPSLFFSKISGSANEGSSSSETVNITVNLNRATTVDITVPITYSGTATPNTDYSELTTSLTIAAGNTSGLLNFKVIGDSTGEPDETLVLKMGTPVNAGLDSGLNTYTHTIINDDLPEINISHGGRTSSENSFSYWYDQYVNLNLSSPSIYDILIPIEYLGTASTTQSFGVDYIIKKTGSGSSISDSVNYIKIPAGNTSGYINYTITPEDVFETDETLIISLGEPTNAQLGSKSTFIHTIQNDDNWAKPYVGFYGSTENNSNEGNTGTTDFIITAFVYGLENNRPDLSGIDISIPISIGGNATLGNDFSVVGDSIFIPAGSRFGTFEFSVLGDSTVESNETVVLTMGTPTGATLGANTSYTHTITNDDIPTISFATTTSAANEGNSGNQIVNVTANLSSATTAAVTVPITYSGTATSGTDYTNTPTSITIAVGATTGTASFSVVGDTALETNETVVLTMGTPTGATLGANTSYTHAITNDDVPTISFATTTSAANEGNSGNQTVNVTANLSSAATAAVTVPITYSGTATSGSDYIGATNLITIAAGSTTGTASFSVVGDTALESNETVVLTMGTPTGATVGSNTFYTYTITNDEVVIGINATNSSVYENGSLNTIYTFTRTGDLSAPLSVNFAVSGTAHSSDYTSSLNVFSEPNKVWTKLLGTTAVESADALAIGSDGSIYVAGKTAGNLDGQVSWNNGSYDYFVSKFLTDGTKTWTNVLGSSSNDKINSLAVAADGHIYVTGETLGNLDNRVSFGQSDGFLIRYLSDGTKEYGTALFGSNASDFAYAISSASDGALYLSGSTNGWLFGQPHSGGGDAFVIKYLPDLSRSWTKVIGSNAKDEARALTMGSDGSIFVGGITQGNFDGQTNSGGYDAFITKYLPDGTKAWTNLLGSVSNDQAYAMTTGIDGSIYISGGTEGNLGGQTNSGLYDVFVAKYSTDGNLDWARLLGSRADDISYAITAGLDGSIYVGGKTWSTDFDGQISLGGGYDAFITKFLPDGTKAWSTVLSSDASDEIRALSIGLDGSLYASGETTGHLEGQTNSGGSDAFIIKYQVTPQIIFAAGSATATLVIDPTADNLIEGKETVVVTLAEGVGYWS